MIAPIVVRFVPSPLHASPLGGGPPSAGRPGGSRRPRPKRQPDGKFPAPSCVHHSSDCPITATACLGRAGGGRQPSVGRPAGPRRRHPPAGRFPSPLLRVPPICVPSHRDRLVTCVPLLSDPASSDCPMRQGHLRCLRLALLACIHRLGTEEGRGKALTANQDQQEDTEE